jgi:replication initiation protein RepC
MQQDALGLSETQVKVLNRAFIEAGLITMKDGPNGKRYSKRDSEGCIIEASGFDLSPLAARYAGLIHLVAAAKAERAEMTQLEAENASSSIANSPTAALLEGYLDTPERYLGSYELSNSLNLSSYKQLPKIVPCSINLTIPKRIIKRSDTGTFASTS